MTARFYGAVEPLSDLEVLVVASTEQLARDNCVLVQSGLDLTNYRKNPIVLFQHQPTSPVGTTTAIGFDGDVLAARIEFAPIGVSQIADQARALVKSGVLRGISIGFDAKETEPLDKKKPYGGQRITKSELLEISFVSIPADTGAGVVARWHGARAGERLGSIAAIPRIPHAAIARAAALLPQASPGRVISPTMQVWALQEAERQRERELFSYSARQAELRRLGSKNGGGYSTH
jgi:HK97 family phage prohead protease